MKITLKSVFINTSNKDGVPYQDKNGTPYHMAVITSESGNKASRRIWSNEAHILQHIQTWRPGDEVEVDITQNGEYYNFDVNVKPLTENRVRELIKEGFEAYKKEQELANRYNGEVMSTPVHSEEPINVDNLPF